MFQPRQFLLQTYRLGILVLMAVTIREHHFRVRLAGDAPVRVAEAKELIPEASSMEADHGPRQGWHLLDAEGRQIGYIVRTQPFCRDVIGYCGITDTLVALDAKGRIAGLKIRSSEDTKRHVEDVATDRQFMKIWKGMSWEQVANLDLKAAGIDGVSGATQTSMGIARSLVKRFAMAERVVPPPPWQIGVRDIGLAIIMLLGGIMCFARPRGHPHLRRYFQALVVVYVGFLTGDLISQSLLAGYARAGMNWRLAPGLALFVTAAFIVPWATGRPFYCQHLCPYGALQEWVGRKDRRWSMPPALDGILRILPIGLLAVMLVVIMWSLPLDPADIEPFDAFVIKSAGWATITMAVAGLIAARFIPQAYCRYGCPTGALLEFARARGKNDRFGWRDWAALLLVLCAALLAAGFDSFHAWLNA